MSENKRYFFLQLPEDFFSSKRIKKLRKLAGGDTFTIIYLKLQLFSLNNSGLIEWSGLEETLAEELALEIDESPENIAVTLKYLLSCGLAEIKNEQDIHLPYVEKMTSSHTASTERSRRFRAKAKELADRCESVALQRECNADATQDIRDKSEDIRDESIKERIPLKGDKKESPQKSKRLSLEEAKQTVLNSDLTTDLVDALLLWLEYKYLDRKDKYAERGMTQLINSAKACAKEYGTVPAERIVKYSIEREWQGILWEKAKDYADKPAPKAYEHGSVFYRAAKTLSKRVSDRLGLPEDSEETKQAWAAEMESLAREMNIDPDGDMREALFFSQESDYWKGRILDAKSFRRNFRQILSDMRRRDGA